MSPRAPGDPLARFLRSRAEAGWMPGACWWVERRGAVVSRGAVGAAAIEPHPEPLTESTPFDLASLTKPLSTALLLALFEQQGRVELEAPLGSLLPELAGSRWAAASLLELGCHATGLAAWRPLYLGSCDLSGYLREISREAPAAPAGRPLYSDLGYIVLGAAAARIGAASLDRLFRRHVAEPLGLPRIGYAVADGAFADAAATERGNVYERGLAGRSGAAYAWRERLLRGEVHDANAHALGGVAGHAGLFGTAVEVAAIGRELLEPRRLPLGGRARSRLLEPQDRAAGRTFGCVAARHSQAARGILPPRAPGHTGFTGTSLWLDPHEQTVFVLLTNRVHPRVPERNFQLLRRGFHRVAAAICRRG